MTTEPKPPRRAGATTWRTRIRIFVAVLAGLGVAVVAFWEFVPPQPAPEAVWVLWPQSVEGRPEAPVLVVSSPGDDPLPGKWLLPTVGSSPSIQINPLAPAAVLVRVTPPGPVARTLAWARGTTPPAARSVTYWSWRDTLFRDGVYWRWFTVVQ